MVFVKKVLQCALATLIKLVVVLFVVTRAKMISDDNGNPRVNLATTNNPEGGLFGGVAVSTACVIIRRKPATQAQSRQKSSKNPRL